MNNILQNVIMCVRVLLACIVMHHMHAWCMWKPENSIRSSATGVADNFEQPRGLWKLNPYQPNVLMDDLDIGDLLFDIDQKRAALKELWQGPACLTKQ